MLLSLCEEPLTWLLVNIFVGLLQVIVILMQFPCNFDYEIHSAITTFYVNNYHYWKIESVNKFTFLYLLAADLTLRCCLTEHSSSDSVEHCGGGNQNLRGLAIATCCHHLCQWKHYISNQFILPLKYMNQ